MILPPPSRARAVARWACLSRLVVFLLAALATLVAQPYDCSSAVRQYPASRGTVVAAGAGAMAPAVPPKAATGLARTVLSPFTHWDAVYFLRIAETGTYEFEQFHAFFPGLPAATRAVRDGLRLVLPGGGGGGGGNEAEAPQTLTVFAGVLVTHASFVGAAVTLYWLGVAVLRDEALAFSAALLFCFSPASIFFSAVYTESPFALASFACMLCVHRAGAAGGTLSLTWMLAGTAAAVAATGVRSNGIVLSGFALHLAAQRIWAVVRSGGRERPGILLDLAYTSGPTVGFVAGVLRTYVAFQRYGYDLYCTGDGGPRRPWCESGSLYGFVQAEYWKVGFMRYWVPKQIPNFLLAGPVFALVVGMVRVFGESCGAAAAGAATGGAKNLALLECALGLGGSTATVADITPPVAGKTKRGPSAFARRATAVYVWHCAALALIACVWMHVQVATRFLLAASPALYWYAADMLRRSGSGSNSSRLVLGYFAAYFTLGTVLHGTFYPWT